MKKVNQDGASVNSMESQRKEGLRDRFRGLTWDELLLPIAPWLQASWGPLEFRRCMPVGNEEEKGKGLGVLPVGENKLCPLS